MTANKYRVSAVVARLGEGKSTAVLAHPSDARAAMECVGQTLCLSLSRLFCEILSARLLGTGRGSAGLGRLANTRFYA